MVLDGRWGEQGEQGGTTHRERRGGERGEGRGGEGRGRCGRWRRGEENRTGKGALLSWGPSLPSLRTRGRHPRQSLPMRPMRFGRDPTTHLAGVFGLNSVNYPPRFPAEFPPSAVCRRLRGKGPEPKGRTSGSSMRESGPMCDCAVCFFQLCSESSQSRAFSAPHFAKATWWLGSCTCMGTGEGADEEEGACGARSKRPRLNPPTRTSKLLASSRRGVKLCSIEGYFPPWKTKR